VITNTKIRQLNSPIKTAGDKVNIFKRTSYDGKMEDGKSKNQCRSDFYYTEVVYAGIAGANFCQSDNIKSNY
jgi:hypothetical protein